MIPRARDEPEENRKMHEVSQPRKGSFLHGGIPLASRLARFEHQQFGEDGFDEAVKQISEIELELGLADLGAFTAPPAL